MFKDLLVPITGTPGDEDAIDTAIAIAASFDAHLSILELINLPMLDAGPWGLVSEELVDIYKTLRDQAKNNADGYRERLAKEAISSEVRIAEALYMEPYRLAARCSRYCDLTVVAGAAGSSVEVDAARRYAASALLASGRPVLAVPRGAKVEMPPKRIVAAWKPTKEATRAFHDGLPFFKAAEIVEILIVNPIGGDHGHGEEPGADIASHLARHGVKANVFVFPAGEDSVASTVIRHAERVHAGMIVAGGYGHSRVREWVLGGATRELLAGSRLPLMLSH